MKATLIDTDTISLFLRNQPQVVSKFGAYLGEYGTINFSIITYYEIVSGLKHRDARKQLLAFQALASHRTECYVFSRCLCTSTASRYTSR